MRRTAPLLALLVIAALAGCSSTADPTPTSTEPVTTSQAPAPSESAAAEPTAAAETLESIAAAAGLTDFARSTSAAPGAIAWGSGTLDGKTVKVYEFADDAGYEAFIASVAGFGITEEQLIHVGTFAFAPDDQTQLEQLRAAVS